MMCDKDKQATAVWTLKKSRQPRRPGLSTFDVAYPDGPLMCHVVARVGACGAAGVVVYCGWSGLFTGWVVFVVRRIVVIAL